MSARGATIHGNGKCVVTPHGICSVVFQRSEITGVSDDVARGAVRVPRLYVLRPAFPPVQPSLRTLRGPRIGPGWPGKKAKNKGWKDIDNVYQSPFGYATHLFLWDLEEVRLMHIRPISTMTSRWPVDAKTNVFSILAESDTNSPTPERLNAGQELDLGGKSGQYRNLESGTRDGRHLPRLR